MTELLIEYPYLLALLIFISRVADVSLGTFRTIVIFRGYKFFASFIGFFEITIWLIAALQVFQNINQWYLILAYASGFSTGIYVGMWIENYFAIGDELIRCISFNRDILANKIREAGYTVVSVEGNLEENKPVEVLFIIEKRRYIPQLIKLIKEVDKNALYSVSGIKSVYEGTSFIPRHTFLSKNV